MAHVGVGPIPRPNFTTGEVSAQTNDTVSIGFRLCNYRIALTRPYAIGRAARVFSTMLCPNASEDIRGVDSSGNFFVNGFRDDVQIFRDLCNAQSVEVLKGPSAITFGRGVGGGLVNRR
jgi:hypothetical protein